MNMMTDDHDDDNSMNRGIDPSLFLEVAVLLTTLELESSSLELVMLP